MTVIACMVDIHTQCPSTNPSVPPIQKAPEFAKKQWIIVGLMMNRLSFLKNVRDHFHFIGSIDIQLIYVLFAMCSFSELFAMTGKNFEFLVIGHDK